MASRLSLHLKRLEAESIEIIREVAAEFRRPVLLYSIGKDSSVMLHLALKAFYPGKLPFPLLHVDTTWKFRAMIQFRDETAKKLDLELIVHVNKDGLARGINPFDSGSVLHTAVMKTEALRQALDLHRFDAALGGARRDEEKSRAKERIFSVRNANHGWDPRNQRPELWKLFNTKILQGDSVRVFPLSNWTELDAAGMIAFALRCAINVHREPLAIDKAARARLKHQRPCILWFTGLPASGKSTIARLVEQRLAASGHHTYMLDGDNLRHGLNRDLGFTDADRVENIRRAGEVAKVLVEAGLIVLCAFISPFRPERKAIRELVDTGEFIEIFVDTPIEECEKRDPKGLYAKARTGAIPNFTGIDSPYQTPDAPEITLRTTQSDPLSLADEVIAFLEASGYLRRQ